MNQSLTVKLSELESKALDLNQRIKKRESEIMDKYREIKDFSNENDYSRVERIGKMLSSWRFEVTSMKRSLVDTQENIRRTKSDIERFRIS